MRNTFFSLFALSILYISCNSNHEKTLAFLDERIVSCNKATDNHIEDEFAKIQMIHSVYPEVTENVFKQSMIIKQELDTLIKDINVINGINYTMDIDDINHMNNKNQLLFSHIDRFKKVLTSVTENGETKQRIEENLNYSFYKNSDRTKEKLHLLVQRINYACYVALLELNESVVDTKIFNHSTFKPIVIQNLRTLKKGDELFTRVFLSITDTTEKYRVILGKDTFLSNNGRVKYKMKPESIGKHSLKGIFEVSDPRFDEYFKLPFEFKYLVYK